ncbi:MAG: protein translocase subunit SecF, partial [Candidatus Latescibacterota bacterium]
GFALALTAGVFVGTYSSIFIASPILVAWRERSERRRQEKVQVRRKR